MYAFCLTQCLAQGRYLMSPFTVWHCIGWLAHKLSGIHPRVYDRVSFVQRGIPFLQASSVWQHQTIHNAGRREDLLNCCTKLCFSPVARYSCPARLSDNLSGAGCKPSSAASGSVGGTAALSVCWRWPPCRDCVWAGRNASKQLRVAL